MSRSPYGGPSVFGYETDAPLSRVAGISVHTSPLATLGGKDAGGMNVYVRELACHLAALGLPVDLFTRRTSPDTPETVTICPNVNVIAITAGPPEPLPKTELFPLLPEFAEQMVLYSLRQGVRYDVVHAHYWLSGWVAHLLRRYWDTPFVQMFHTTAHMKNAVSGVADREPEQRIRVEGQLFGLADSLIAANPNERADLIWRHRTPTEKVCTVPPGVDTDLFRPLDQATCRAAIGLDTGAKVVLFVGRVDPIKGIDTLLEAAPLVASNRSHVPPTYLFVGGDLDATGTPVGPLAEVARRVDGLGLTDRFRLVGSQPQNELPCYYGAADVVAVPSRYESFGLVAVEAMACGVPVVASRVGGMSFTVEEDVSGFLVPMGSAPDLAAALSRVLSDEPLRRRMAHDARVAAGRFSWPAVAAAILHVYERLATGHRADLCCDEDLYA